MTDKNLIPPNDLTIWRYMTFPQFVNLLQFQKLHFTRGDMFEDVLEGKLPNLSLHGKSNRKTFLNCWSGLEKECYAMWQIYGKKFGIAICTTVGNLEQAIKTSNIRLSWVKYVDFMTQAEDTHPYVYKSIVYEFEREVRAIMINESEEKYQYVKIDIEPLIGVIYISPFAGTWFRDLVKELVYHQYNLTNKQVLMSNIALNR